MITSQLPIEHWYAMLGESMRKKLNSLTDGDQEN